MFKFRQQQPQGATVLDERNLPDRIPSPGIIHSRVLIESAALNHEIRARWRDTTIRSIHIDQDAHAFRLRCIKEVNHAAGILSHARPLHADQIETGIRNGRGILILEGHAANGRHPDDQRKKNKKKTRAAFHDARILDHAKADAKLDSVPPRIPNTGHTAKCRQRHRAVVAAKPVTQTRRKHARHASVS